ncbi:MAG: hypothetical protein PHU25_22420 [Deltaproteobacteria bacterium]|nr:hypothetical protein [Deltaproteobacteria bacterium]
MITLTARAAKRWKVAHASLPPVETGAWVVDLMKLGKGPLLVLIVHQETLFSLLRPAAVVKTLDQVSGEITRVCPGRAPAVTPLYRNGNRRVTGTITDMKYMIRVWALHWALPVVEEKINDTPFSAIGMDLPRERFERFLKGEGDELGRKNVALKLIPGGRMT